MCRASPIVNMEAIINKHMETLRIAVTLFPIATFITSFIIFKNVPRFFTNNILITFKSNLNREKIKHLNQMNE